MLGKIRRQGQLVRDYFDPGQHCVRRHPIGDSQHLTGTALEAWLQDNRLQRLAFRPAHDHHSFRRCQAGRQVRGEFAEPVENQRLEARTALRLLLGEHQARGRVGQSETQEENTLKILTDRCGNLVGCLDCLRLAADQMGKLSRHESTRPGGWGVN